MCSQCGICAEVCPENAISVVKILKGVHKVDLDKCFGVDCQICREVCPNLAVEYRYLPEKEVVFNSRCNFCGACEVFCPANAIEIERDMIDVLNELPIPLDVRDRRKLRGERVTKEIVIDESCFGCGLCSSICSLIKEGRTFQIVDGRGEVISTEMCTMCGVCAENCPVSAISLKEIG
jgi:4Fe-4S ferredoxin